MSIFGGELDKVDRPLQRYVASLSAPLSSSPYFFY